MISLLEMGVLSTPTILQHHPRLGMRRRVCAKLISYCNASQWLLNRLTLVTRMFGLLFNAGLDSVPLEMLGVDCEEVCVEFMDVGDKKANFSRGLFFPITTRWPRNHNVQRSI